ncbi:MAG: hypothetical protein ACKVX7_07895 [Planctomycetota bacterium]
MRRRAFVVMPYGVKPVEEAAGSAHTIDFDRVYAELFEPALCIAEFEPFRADQGETSNDIRTDMYFELVTADLVLIDVSLPNPNVFYELGVRHGASPIGALLVSGGFSQRPFNIAPDRIFAYQGKLWLASNSMDPEERRKTVELEAERLGKVIRRAVEGQDRSVSSPVYKELPGLRPVDWADVRNARAKYFHGVVVDWEQRMRNANAEGRLADLLTLAEDMPTPYHQKRLLFAAGKALISSLSFMAAKSVFEEIQRADPEHVGAIAQFGLLKNLTGRPQEARTMLEAHAAKNPRDLEVQRVLGRVYQDLWIERWKKCDSLSERQTQAMTNSGLAISAIRSFERDYLHDLNSFISGVSLVGLATLLEHLEKATGRTPAERLATDYLETAAAVRIAAREAARRAEVTNDGNALVWSIVSLGALALLRGDGDEAERYYSRAACSPSLTRFQLESIRLHLKICELLDFQTSVATRVTEAINNTSSFMPIVKTLRRVFLCSGHMIDRPERATPRFPASKELPVRARLQQHLDDWKVGDGDLAICGGARGADLLFAELCLERGAELRICLPTDEAEFLTRSVRLKDSDWENRFFAAAKRAKIVRQAECLGPAPENLNAYRRHNAWMRNMARIEANWGEIYALLVWDEIDGGDSPGGTAHFAREVERLGGRQVVINPTKIPAGAPVAATGARSVSSHG